MISKGGFILGVGSVILLTNTAFAFAPKNKDHSYKNKRRTVLQIENAATYNYGHLEAPLLWVSEVRYFENSAVPSEALSSLTQDIESCGIEFGTPNCLDLSIEEKEDSDWRLRQKAVVDSGDGITLITLLPHKITQGRLALLIDGQENENQFTPKSATVHLVPSGTKNAEAAKNAYLLQKTTRVLEISFPPHTLEFIAQELQSEVQKPLDYRRLFHMVKHLKALDAKKTYHLSSVEVLQRHYQIITQSNSIPYQLATLEFLLESFSQDRDLCVLFAKDLLLSTEPKISQVASILLAESGEQSDLIRLNLKNALKNPNWRMRQRAVKALGKAILASSNPSEDKNSIISMMGDSDSDVRSSAHRIAFELRLTNDELPSLKALIQNKSWEVRRDGILLAGSIRTPEATRLLLNGLVDSDSDVRKATRTQVALRKLATEDAHELDELSKTGIADARVLVAEFLGEISCAQSIQTLTTLSTDSNWSVRNQAITGLGKSFTPQAIQAVIARLVDTDKDVQANAKSIVDRYTLTNTELPFLSAQLLGRSWEHRRQAVKYIGTIATSKATEALIPMLVDTDEDVRNETVNHLKKRNFTEVELEKLSQHIHHGNAKGRILIAEFISRIKTQAATLQLKQMSNDASWEVRLAVVKGLGQIDSPLSTSILLSRIGDSDSDVKTAVHSALNGRSLNDDHVKALGELLDSDRYDAREHAAKYLGKSRNPNAIPLLTERLLNERDDSVLTQIKSSIRILRMI